MCSEAKVESQRLRSGKLAADDWPRLTAACDKLAKAPIYVDDTGSMTIMGIRAKARRLKSKEPNLGLIIVDYLQLMSSDSNYENRVQEVSQISRQLKILARELDLPIIAMSQLSRAVEQRHDKRPILSDLRESGAGAGRRPRRVHLPRRVLQRGEPGPGARRGHPRQAPQRADRPREAVVPAALREVRRPGSSLGRRRLGSRAAGHAVAVHAQHDQDLRSPAGRRRQCAGRAAPRGSRARRSRGSASPLAGRPRSPPAVTSGFDPGPGRRAAVLPQQRVEHRDRQQVRARR